MVIVRVALAVPEPSLFQLLGGHGVAANAMVIKPISVFRQPFWMQSKIYFRPKFRAFVRSKVNLGGRINLQMTVIKPGRCYLPRRLIVPIHTQNEVGSSTAIDGIEHNVDAHVIPAHAK